MCHGIKVQHQYCPSEVFGSIRYPLNQFKTLTKNFSQGLNSGELVWKMAKPKYQKQH